MAKTFCPITWKHFTINLWLGHKTYSVPFTWCSEENILKISPNGRSRIKKLIFANMIYMFYLSLTIFYDWSTSNVFIEPETFGDIVMRAEYMIVISNTFVLLMNLLYLTPQYIRYINEWIQLYFYFSDKYVLAKFKPWRLPCDILLELISFTYFLLPISQIVHFFEFPRSKTYILWAFTSVDNLVIIVAVYIVHIVVIVMLMIGNYCVCLFHVYICLIPLTICIKALKESKPGINPFLKFRTVNALRGPGESLKIYRAHYILNQQANVLGSHMLYFLQTAGSYAIVFSLICLLHFGLDVGYKTAFLLLIVAFFGLGLWLAILETAGMLTNRTKLWVTQWNKAIWPRYCNKSYCKKIARTLKPFQLDCSGYYKLTLLRVLRFINFIMWTAMKGLLFISKPE